MRIPIQHDSSVRPDVIFALYDKIFRLAELKGLIAKFNDVETRQGVFKESAGFAESVEVDKLISDLQDQVQSLPSELDEFNHTQSVDL